MKVGDILIINNIRNKFLSFNIKKHKKKMQNLYNGSNVTIISNNCLAGVIYNILGLEFCSPTINQWMKMAEYYEFVSDLKYYMQCELAENVEESKNWKFPVGTLIAKDTFHNNLNIYFNHYDTFENAKTKWEKRKQNILWDKLYVIYDFNDKDFDGELLYKFDELPYKHKISLTHYKSFVEIKNTYKMNCISDNEDIVKEFDYDGLSGKRYFEEWNYIDFLTK